MLLVIYIDCVSFLRLLSMISFVLTCVCFLYNVVAVVNIIAITVVTVFVRAGAVTVIEVVTVGSSSTSVLSLAVIWR